VVIQTQVSGRRSMTMCTISKCTFVHIGPFRHDKVNVLSGGLCFYYDSSKQVYTGGVKRLVSDSLPRESRSGGCDNHIARGDVRDVIRWVVSERLPTQSFALSVWADSIHSRGLTPKDSRLHATPECSTAQRCQYGVTGMGAPTFRLQVDAPFGAVDMDLGPALGQVQQVGCLLELLVELITVSVWLYIVSRVLSSNQVQPR